MKRTWLRAIGAAVVVVCALPALAASRVDCTKMPSKILGRDVPYCVMLPPSYDEQSDPPTSKNAGGSKTPPSGSAGRVGHPQTEKKLQAGNGSQGRNGNGKLYPVVYYLHGLGDNEQSLVNGGGWQLYEQLLDDKKIGEYIIVTPYGYRSFYINSRNGKFPYEDFFVKEFMPAIEKKYRVKAVRGSRGIMGVSMGGYGAMHYAFKYPAKFAAVSGHMSALMENPPANLGDSREGKLLAEIFGNPLDKAYYQRNSPFTYARTQPAAQLNKLAIYFDVGSSDGYGFDSGNQEMDKLLTSRGVKHEFHVYPGGHNWSFVIEHFGKSLQWQSGAMR